MTEHAAQWLNWVALIGAPVVGGGIASLFALRSSSPTHAREIGCFGTLGFGVILAMVAGLAIDILHPGFMPPAIFALGAAEVILSGVAGFVVGRACARYVGKRERPVDSD